MKVQFCFNGNIVGDIDVIAEFDVAKVPTEEQCKAVEEHIFNAINNWSEENDDDFAEFDYWYVCYEAAKEHLDLVLNPVVKTFYL